MTKLTLSVDENVVARAKEHASRHGTSVSRLVETYLDALSAPLSVSDVDLPPITRRLRGVLKGSKSARRQDYIAYLERKYR